MQKVLASDGLLWQYGFCGGVARPEFSSLLLAGFLHFRLAG